MSKSKSKKNLFNDNGFESELQLSARIKAHYFSKETFLQLIEITKREGLTNVSMFIKFLIDFLLKNYRNESKYLRSKAIIEKLSRINEVLLYEKAEAYEGSSSKDELKDKTLKDKVFKYFDSKIKELNSTKREDFLNTYAKCIYSQIPEYNEEAEDNIDIKWILCSSKTEENEEFTDWSYYQRITTLLEVTCTQYGDKILDARFVEKGIIEADIEVKSNEISLGQITIQQNHG